MTYFSLLLALSFVLVAVIISFKENLGLERDLLIGTVRAFVQLMVVGYVLEFIFALEKWPYIVAMLVFMVLVAARNAEKRGRGIRNVFPILLLAIGAGELAGLFRHGWRNSPAQRKTSCGDVGEEHRSEPQDGEYA